MERWKEYREQLQPLAKKPIFFVMMNNTEEADDVGDWPQKKYPSEFGGDKLLIIHTDRSGDVSTKDLQKARRVAREVDDERSPVNCIVSVLMLREGWDVQGVTVIVGLRPYTSKAKSKPQLAFRLAAFCWYRVHLVFLNQIDEVECFIFHSIRRRLITKPSCISAYL